MQAVGSPELALALGRLGGLGFIHHNQSAEAQAAAIAEAKAGSVLAGAGINTHDYRERVPELIRAGADLLCFDASDGFSDWQAEGLRWIKQHFPTTPVGGGNVIDARGFRFLAEAGADFVKVGIGGGAICITRDQKGIGRGQASALLEIAAARDEFAHHTDEYVPLCSDGGLLQDSHIAMALAMGADFVMMGRYFARFDQAAGAKVRIDGAYYKEYWAEGSHRARNWQRYREGDAGGSGLAFEEGVDGYVPYAGDVADALAETVAKIKATMVSCGARTVAEFTDVATLTIVSEQTLGDSGAEVVVRDDVN